jgi:hypothetical protein
MDGLDIIMLSKKARLRKTNITRLLLHVKSKINIKEDMEVEGRLLKKKRVRGRGKRRVMGVGGMIVIHEGMKLSH